MFCPSFLSQPYKLTSLPGNLLISLATLFLLSSATLAKAQTLSRQFDTSDNPSVSIINRNGRVSVIASAETQKQVNVEARSAGLPVGESDISTEVKGGKIAI